MSSNTLRGIGQDEGGDNDAADPAGKDKDKEKDKDRDKDAGSSLASGVDGGVVASAPGGDATERTEDGSAHLTERGQERGQERVNDLRIIRSLDATIPGTRSLDSSVPEARPPLDAKVPGLASTLLGVAAPIVSRGDREKGTVQGRDVHLPVEAQRVAGIHSAVAPVGGANLHLEAAPHPIERSEPTLADPVRTAALAHVAGTAEGVRGHAHADLNSHGPWYDQDPTAGQDVYEDRKPSVLGRVAIGVAVAAGLSVIVFAILRLASADDRDARPAAAVDPYGFPAHPTSPASPSSPASRASPPTSRTPSSLPVGATGSTPLEGSSAQDDLPPPGVVAPSGDGSLNIDSPEGPTARRGKPVAAARPGAASKPGVAASPGKAAGHGVTAAPGPTAAAAPLSNELATPVPTTPPPLAKATTEPSNSANTANSAPAGPPPVNVKPAAPDKPRGKNYDPDSTLPLNID